MAPSGGSGIGHKAVFERRRRPLRKPGDDVAPATRSMYQSSLYHKDDFSLPQIRALDTVQSALQNDATSQSLKYEAEEPGPRSARFCVDLPRSPQHQKYCMYGTRSEAASCGDDYPALEAPQSPSSPHARPPRAPRPKSLKGVGFNKHTLHLLFREIDRKASGFVTHRGLMFAMHTRLHDKLVDAKSVRDATNWLREIAKEVDVENRGNMTWKTFLEFFRRAGLLVEQLEDNPEVDHFKDILQAKQDQMKSLVMADIGEEHKKMQSEIGMQIGFGSVARFNKNRRAGSPTGLGEDEDEELGDTGGLAGFLDAGGVVGFLDAGSAAGFGDAAYECPKVAGLGDAAYESPRRRTSISSY